MRSQEFRRLARSPAYAAAGTLALPRRPRVLLFGAYGNGNLGDAIQATSLARAIGSIRPDVEVWASSALPAAYPFAYNRILPPEAVAKPDLVNSFDLLIVGGGGLLAHPHDPLTDPKWQEGLELPVVFLGIGADDATAGKSGNLLRKAVYVSGRDGQSVAALSRFSNAVGFVPDPVLSDIAYLPDASSDPPKFNRTEKRLWILKSANHPQLLDLCRCIAESDDMVCFLEPHLDFELVEHIPHARPIYCVDDLLAMIDEAKIVFSMRYHGCILAMLRGKPVFGLREPKCLSLLERYGNGQWFSSELASPSCRGMSFAATDTKLAEDRVAFLDGLNAALAFIYGEEAPLCQMSGR